MPIITSRLDNDFYNFTMGQVVFKHYPLTRVEYKFVNRTREVKLSEVVDIGRLHEEIEHARTLAFTKHDLDYLRATGAFGHAYLNYLKTSVLPEVAIRSEDGQLFLSYEGRWSDAVFWETPLLAIVSQLYNEALTRRIGSHAALEEGRRRRVDTVTAIQSRPEIRFIEFGTRRRFSQPWQQETVEELIEHVPDQLVGTSNVELAARYGLRPSGTMAHQLFMVVAALEVAAGTPNALVAAQNKVLDLWEEEYADKLGGRLLVALTDTYGTDFFLRNLSPEQARSLLGMRQDSGDPYMRCRQLLNYYRSIGEDPFEHFVVPSDGLTADDMIYLSRELGRDVPLVFGCGGHLTNNMGRKPVSIVIKPSLANGQPCVKLSDNLAKAVGNPVDIEKYKRLAGYSSSYERRPDV